MKADILAQIDRLRDSAAALPNDWPWLHHPLAVIDIETTGLDRNARIVEIGVINIDRGQVVDEWESLVNPGIPIPPDSTRVHGISDADVADAPTFAEIVRDLEPHLRYAVPIAHNAGFDKRLIVSELRRCRIELTRCPAADPEFTWIDTMQLARRYVRGLSNHKLPTVAKRFDIKLESNHRALQDARVCMWSLLSMEKAGLLPRTLGELQVGKRATRR
jgi:DNA polymerase III epsilon subunit family exonuclease